MKRNHKTTGAAALVDSLTKAGVETIFGYPGGNVIDIFDELAASGIGFVLGRHEQGCVHMADGYARASGRPGVAVVTSGPGLTNTITGLGAANMDGVPLVLVCGQVPLPQIGTDAFQEADTTGLTRGVSKHNFLVHRADEIPETVAQAFYIATHGKPGPVVIDIPRDVQRALTAAVYPERVVLRSYHPESTASTAQVNRLAKMINEAKRPVFFAGGGVIASGAAEDVARLSRKAGIPVVTTMMGIGSVDGHDPLSLGMAGMHGNACANRALAQADLIVALGVRFSDRVTGEPSAFAGHARIVHVDIDPASIDKNIRVDMGIVADVKDLLTTVDSRVKSASRSAWLRTVAGWKEKSAAAPAADPGDTSVSPAAVVDAVCRACGGDVIIATDVGRHQLWATRHLRCVYPRHFITSGGMGAMGFGIPAAIGAAIARPGHKVVSLVGDGGAQMTFQELIVAAELNLPVTFVVFKNSSLGLVRQMQRQDFGGRYFATDLRSPDFLKLASAYGIRAARVTGPGDLEAAVFRAVRSRRPFLLEVEIDKEVEA